MSINPAPAFYAACGVETGFHVATCQTGAKERREAKELRQPVTRQALVGEIDPSDLAVCRNAHLNAFIAEWDVPEDLVYTPGRPGASAGAQYQRSGSPSLKPPGREQQRRLTHSNHPDAVMVSSTYP